MNRPNGNSKRWWVWLLIGWMTFLGLCLWGMERGSAIAPPTKLAAPAPVLVQPRFQLPTTSPTKTYKESLGWAESRVPVPGVLSPLKMQALHSQGLSRLAQNSQDSGQPVPGTSPADSHATADSYSTVDFVPQQHRTGQSLYLKNCATCHLGIPPQVLPSETWRNLIQDESHYGATIQPPLDPSRGLIWAYLRNGSRQKSNREERAPYQLQQSQYFKALHPRVDLPRPIGLNSCASCHPAAAQFNFRQLTSDWIDGR